MLVVVAQLSVRDRTISTVAYVYNVVNLTRHHATAMSLLDANRTQPSRREYMYCNFVEVRLCLSNYHV